MTTPQKPIVVGIDGSPAAQRALRWAVAEAALRGTTVQAVTAWNWTGPDLQGQVSEEAARAQAQRILAGALQDTGATAAPVERRLVEGAPARVLVEAAQEASLLVVGNHRHGTTYRALIGSVADACLRSSMCPVVMVTAHCPDQPADAGASAGQPPDAGGSA